MSPVRIVIECETARIYRKNLTSVCNECVPGFPEKVSLCINGIADFKENSKTWIKTECKKTMVV